MLPRESRLASDREIRAVSRSGSRARAGDIAVSISRSGLAPAEGWAAPAGRADRVHDVAPWRGCVIVGRPCGGAVQRNRQRRRLRHALAEVAPVLPYGAQVVVRGGPGVAALSPIELRHELRGALARAVRRSVRRDAA